MLDRFLNWWSWWNGLIAFLIVVAALIVGYIELRGV